MKNISLVAVVVLLATTAVVGPAAAATFRVSSNGLDSGTCGTGTAPPCATIQQAVSNASDGDSIQVGPGSYAGATVNKVLRLWSGNGTGGALITSQIALAADGIVFGFLGKGFAVDVGGSLNPAILVSGNQVTVRGNRLSNAQTCVQVNGADAIVRDNVFSYCNSAGIQVAGANAQIRGNQMGFTGTAGVSLGSTSTAADVRENRMFGPTGAGIQIDGSGHLVRRNVIQGTSYGISSVGAPAGVHLVENVVSSSLSLGYALTFGSGWVLTKNLATGCHAPGFYLTAGTTFTLTGNVAIGNSGIGFLIQNGSGHTLVDNTAIDAGGSSSGIFLASVGTGVTVSGGNLYGNADNCGLYNSSQNPVTADRVYWGAATGPGLNPADTACGGTVTVTNPASRPAPIKIPPVK